MKRLNDTFSTSRRLAHLWLLAALVSPTCGCPGCQAPEACRSHELAVRVVEGNDQVGAAGAELPNELRVQAYCAAAPEFPLPAHVVRWSVTGGGGTLSQYETLTDVHALASVRWTLGYGPDQEVTVSIVGAQVLTPGYWLRAPAVFNATIADADGGAGADGGADAGAPDGGGPIITSVVPDAVDRPAPRGSPPVTLQVQLQGTDLAVGTPSVSVSGPAVTVSNTTVYGNELVTADLTFDESVLPGERLVTLTNDAGTSNALPFRIGNVTPRIYGVRPVGAQASVTLCELEPGTTTPVVISGDYLETGMTVHSQAEPTAVVLSDVVANLETEASASAVVSASAGLGWHSIYARNSASDSATYPPLKPVVIVPPIQATSITPASGSRGATVAVRVGGTGLGWGAPTVPYRLEVLGSGIAVSSERVVGPTAYDAELAIDANAPLGPVQLRLVTEQRVGTSVTFTVIP